MIGYILLTLILATSAFAESTFSGGDGSANNPYLIENIADMSQLAADVNGGTKYKDTYFRLENNLDYSSVSVVDGSNYTPIGYYDNSHNTGTGFAGIFDGNNKTISGIVVVHNDELGTGLFGYTDGAVIKNLNIEGCSFSGNDHVGGVVGRNKGTIENVYVDNLTTIGGGSGSNYYDSHGGIVGTNLSGSVNANISMASVLCAEGKTCRNFGGIVGNLSGGGVHHSLYLGTQVEGTSRVGAIAGQKNQASLSNSFYPAGLTDVIKGVGKDNTPLGNDIAGQAEFTRTLESMATDQDAVLFIEGDPTTNYSNGISVYSWGLKYNGTSYYKSNGTIKLDYNGSMFINGFACNDANSTCSVSDSILTIGTATKTLAGTSTKGSGTDVSPYLIENADDWNRLAVAVSRGNDFSNKVFKLTNNITVSTMIGTDSEHAFAGTFDGDFNERHTITVAYGGSFDLLDEDYVAPFRFVKGATIKNLQTAGILWTNHKAAASIAGHVQDGITIDSCHSSTELRSQFKSTPGYPGNNGGLVAEIITGNGVITNSYYDGELHGDDTEYNGGMVGWVANGATISFSNSLFNPSYHHMFTNSATFARVSSAIAITLVNSYYTGDYGYSTENAQGVLIQPTLSTTNLCQAIVPVDGNTYYDCNTQTTVNAIDQYTTSSFPITPIPSSVSYGATALTINTDYTVKYKANGSDNELDNIPTSGYYSMIVHGAGDYYGSITKDIIVVAGSGTQEAPYLITSTDDWNILAQMVNSGNSYEGKFFKLTQDIDVSTTIGDGASHPFAGTFDGDNHTITANIVESENKQGAALFRHISGATIKNLTVAGSVTGYIGNESHAAGLVGFALDGSNTVENVTVAANIIGGRYAGGIVGHGKESSLTLTNCVFSGEISGGSSFAGGLLGWSDGSTLTINNCLFKGSYTGGGNFHPVAVRNSGKTMTTSVDYCYYTVEPVNITSDYIAATGVLVYQAPQENYLNRKLTAADGVIYYEKASSNTAPVNSTYDFVSDPITPMPNSVAYNGTTLNAGTDYTVKYKAQGSNEETESISALGYYTMVVYGAGNYDGFMQTQTFQVIKGLQGDGSERNPYLITSEEDWNILANKVNNGVTFEGQFIVLTDDINVTTMVGDTYSHAFKGTFSGSDANNRPTITIDYGSADSELNLYNLAPFRHVSGATIKNLHVAGNIYTNNMYAAGIVAWTEESILIDNCQSSVAIHSSYEGKAFHGGFVSYVSGGTLTIQNSIFDGSLFGSNTRSSGGFVGYINGSLTILNSLFKPSVIDMGTSGSATFTRGSAYTLSECYYTQPFGTAQGTRLYNEPSANTLSKKFTAIDGNSYYLYPTSNTVTVPTYYEIVENNAITPAPTSVNYDGSTLTAETDYTVGYIAEGSNVETESITQAGQYTMVIHGIGDYSGTKTQAILVIQGNGSEEHPYEIATESDWNLLAQEVNAGTTFSGKFFKLTADIGISTTVGNSIDNSFAGTFDGNGHTITVTIGNEQSRFSENYVAPFRYVNGATITDLHTAGAIYTSKQFAAGIAGYVIGNATFESCHSNVTINSSVNGDGTHGGLVARIQGTNVTISIKDSYFDGSILGTSTHSVGGLVGWIEDGQKVDFTNCLFNPQSITVKSDGGRTLARARKYENLTFTDCYYTRSIGTTDQGTLVYIAQETSPFLKKMENALIDGNIYYTDVTATIGGVNPNYNKGTLISAITPSVTISDQPLVQGTDFIVRISKDGNVVSGAMNEDGEHTLTILGIGNYSGSVSTTFWVIHDLDGEGTQSNPYTIANADDWDSFVQKVNNGTTYGGKFVKLTENISVTTMAGILSDEDLRFHGTFDGDNHTITVAYGTTDSPVGDYAAPFSIVTSATIKNLHTSGEIVTNGKFVGGIMGRTTGTVTIDNCSSDVSITKTNNGDGSNGGLVGISSKDNLTIRNSFFSGSFAREGETNSAGFIGWIEDAVVTLNNCLLNPTSIANSVLTSGKTFARPKTASNLTLNNCYYTNSAIFKTSQGGLVSATIPQNGIYKTAQITAADNNQYYMVANITGIQDKYSFQNVPSITPAVTLNGSALAEGTDYTVSLPTIESNGEYQVTVTGTGAFAGTYTKSIWVYGKFNGEGTEGSPYIVATTDDWDAIVQMVKEGETFNGKFLKMTADISVTSMIGSDSTAHYFAGTFDGSGHTLNVTLGNLNSAVSITGPFRYINGATIKSLHVSGNVYVNSWNDRYSNTDHCYGKNAAGLVGFAKGNNLITNVIVSANISAYNHGLYITHGNHGGLIGLIGRDANVTIQNSVFNGGLIQTRNLAVNADGGFIGGGNGSATVIIENSLFDPTQVSMNRTYSHTFGSGATVINSYYTSDKLEHEGQHEGTSGIGKDATELATLLGRTWHVVDGKAVPFYNYSETQYGAVTVAIGDGSTTAYINGLYNNEDAIDIPSAIDVDAVVFNRTFSTDGYSTIMLPFSTAKSNVTGLANAYEFTAMDYDENGKKVVKMTAVDNLVAYTPYIIELDNESLVFSGSATLAATQQPVIRQGDWEFRGTLQKTVWDSEHPDLGRVYGYSAEATEKVNIGQFVKAAAGAWIRPLRAYLIYNPENDGAGAGKTAGTALGAAEPLPETIDVVVVDRGENGEVSKKVIGTVDTRTGELRMDNWYDMQGRKLNGKPTSKGTYYHNGKAVVVK